MVVILCVSLSKSVTSVIYLSVDIECFLFFLSLPIFNISSNNINRFTLPGSNVAVPKTF